jgi:hypothetical protein
MFFELFSMDMKKAIPESFRDLKEMEYTWYVYSEEDPEREVKFLAKFVPEDER